MTTISEAPTRLPVLDEAGRALLFTDARTANTFAPTPVTDDELRQIWSLAQWPPTAANTQPLRLLWVRTPEGKERLVPHMNEGNRAKTEAAPATAVLAIDRAFYDHIPDLFPARPELRDVFAGNPEMASNNAALSGAIQAGYVILAIRALGLAAGPMGGFDADALDAEFFPDGRFHALLVVNVGHPAEDAFFPRNPRLDHDIALSWA